MFAVASLIISTRLPTPHLHDDTGGGPATVDTLRLAFETATLPNRARHGPFTLKTSLPQAELADLLAHLGSVERSFRRRLPDTRALDGDPNLQWTVVVFGDRATYATYMRAFIGAGAHAGGLYVEREGTLYTFQRSTDDGPYSLHELLRHEVTHALAARFLFPGVWGEPGYHREPLGWLDEGLAEVMAGVDDNDSIRPRAVLLRRLCDRPPTRLVNLLDLRTGYEKPGTFDYATAWSFVYFLHQQAPEVFGRLIASVRSGTYRRSAFDAIAGVNGQDLEARWHAAIHTMCQVNPRSPRPAEQAHVWAPPFDSLAKEGREPLSNRPVPLAAWQPSRWGPGT